MPVTSTPGRILFNEELPAEFRNYNEAMVGSSFKGLLQKIAEERPDLYKEISHKLVQLGREASFQQGSTITLDDMEVPITTRAAIVAKVRKAQRAIEASDVSADDKEQSLRELYGSAQDQLVSETMEASLKAKNPFAVQVLSGARGNPLQLTAMLTSPASFNDAKGRQIPIFAERSYSEGLSPAEYYAATFGARQGVISTKMATREAGDLGKQLSVAAEGLIVTEDDCGTLNGLPVDVGDSEAVGAMLAKNVDGFDMGSVVTGKMFNHLKKSRVKRVLVRSPITCQAKGGICKRCAGLREDGKLPELRDAIGVKAGSALSERIAQGALNVKHCIYENELVMMADWTSRRIKDIKVGDIVMGADEHGYALPTEVVNVFDNGPRRVWQFSFRCDRPGWTGAELLFRSTLDHNIFGEEVDPRSPHECSDDPVLGMSPVGDFGTVLKAVALRGYWDSVTDVPPEVSKGLSVDPWDISDEAYGDDFWDDEDNFRDEDTAERLTRDAAAELRWAAGPDEDHAGRTTLSVDRLRFQRRTTCDLGVRNTRDLEVAHPAHRFVMANGMIVSNSGGQKGRQKTYAGFPMINQLAQIPESFRYQAALSDEEGQVEEVQEAPQGGWNVMINGVAHYVASDQEVLVKPGDNIERGDQLATGVINPAQVVQYKGIGEGRRYFAERFTQMVKDSKLPAHRRNVEVVARAMIDHVDVDDDLDGQGFLPGDVASYSQVAQNYQPRADTTSLRPTAAVGRYLEQPVLHHTIGTRLTKKMAKEIEEFGVDSVQSHEQQPSFTPRMIRLRAVPHYQKDWMAKLHGSYLTTNLLQDAQAGAKSDIHGTNPIPGVALGVEFGQSKPNQVTF